MELIVQKAVELGVCQVIPVETKRCVVKLDDKKATKKVQRWQQIAESAAKQAGRGYIPKVADVMPFPSALELAGELDVCLIPYELAEGMEYTRSVIEAIRPGQSVGIFIGPEGGFEREEVDLALASGAKADSWEKDPPDRDGGTGGAVGPDVPFGVIGTYSGNEKKFEQEVKV